jgi:hypothetical protein
MHIQVISISVQGCQMVYFQTKNPNLGKFWRALEWALLVYFMVIWNILRPFGICIFWPLGNVGVIWYISPVLVYCVKKNLATLSWHPDQLSLASDGNDDISKNIPLFSTYLRRCLSPILLCRSFSPSCQLSLKALFL